MKFNYNEKRIREEITRIEMNGINGIFNPPIGCSDKKATSPDFMFNYLNDNNIKEYIYIETE